MDHNNMHDYIYQLSYLGIFLWFALIEQFNVIPEEISLMTVGYLSVNTSLSPVFAGAVSLAGLLCCDSFLFFISLKGHKLSKKLLKKADSSLVGRIKGHLEKRAGVAIFVMALLPKIRFVSPIIAGVSGISWKVFMLANTLATALYVIVYLLIGILFQRQLHTVFEKLAAWQHTVFIILMVITGIFLLWGIKKLVGK